jgi:hypothetical protein
VTSDDQLFSEVVAIASRLGWPLGEILDLEHPLRRRIIGELDRLTDDGFGGG